MKKKKKKQYEEVIVPALIEKFGYKNKMQVPKLEKIVLNMGIGEATEDKKAIEGAETVSKMGLLETMEVFSLVYDPNAAKFYLSLCYADGKIHTLTYDKFEYCDWKDGDTDETVKWTLADITTDIINDIEGVVPSKLQEK